MSSDSNSKKVIKIGGAAGMWGDSMLATKQLIDVPGMNYLMYESLAEITMSILTLAHARDPEQGYGIDIINTMIADHLEEISQRGIKVITNAGGVNPQAAAARLAEIGRDKGLDLKIAIVVGDDLMPSQEGLRAAGVVEMFSGAELQTEGVISMNAYLGAFPIADALDAGADVVITGRCVDSALVLGPLIHEFGWTMKDYDQLAQGSLAGHLLECGPQSTGGLLTDWDSYDSWANMGFPIAECNADGSFVLTKPDNTDGIVNTMSVAEQTLYEIGNPAQYMLPDVACDFTQVDYTELGKDRVLVKNARGRPPTPYYKACAQQQQGYRVNPIVMISGRDARKKAQRLGESVIERCRKIFKANGYADFSNTNIEVLGAEHYFGANSRQQDSREVLLFLVVHHQEKAALQLFAREFTSLGLASAQGFCTGIVGRGRPAPYIKLLSYLVPRNFVETEIHIGEQLIPQREIPDDLYQELGQVYLPDDTSEQEATAASCKGIEVPLLSIAYGRSGDKGNFSNIALIARDKEFLPLIAEQITSSRVKAYFKHLGVTLVERFAVPGFNAFNFLMHDALGGGGTASLRFDAQGKGLGQNLLEMTVVVPEAVLEHKSFKSFD